MDTTNKNSSNKLRDELEVFIKNLGKEIKNFTENLVVDESEKCSRKIVDALEIFLADAEEELKNNPKKRIDEIEIFLIQFIKELVDFLKKIVIELEDNTKIIGSHNEKNKYRPINSDGAKKVAVEIVNYLKKVAGELVNNSKEIAEKLVNNSKEIAEKRVSYLEHLGEPEVLENLLKHLGAGEGAEIEAGNNTKEGKKYRVLSPFSGQNNRVFDHNDIVQEQDIISNELNSRLKTGFLEIHKN